MQSDNPFCRDMFALLQAGSFEEAIVPVMQQAFGLCPHTGVGAGHDEGNRETSCQRGEAIGRFSSLARACFSVLCLDVGKTIPGQRLRRIHTKRSIEAVMRDPLPGMPGGAPAIHGWSRACVDLVPAHAGHAVSRRMKNVNEFSRRTVITRAKKIRENSDPHLTRPKGSLTMHLK